MIRPTVRMGDRESLDSRSPGERRGWLLVPFVPVVAVAAFGWWYFTANQVDVFVSHSSGIDPVLVDSLDPEPLLVTISPPGRIDGTQVFEDGVPVARPSGSGEGELLVSLERLDAGHHEVEIRVARPLWAPKTLTIHVDVQTGAGR